MAWTFSGSYTTVCPAQALSATGAQGTIVLPVTARSTPSGIAVTGTYVSITAAYGVGGAGTVTLSNYSTSNALGLAISGSSGLVAGNATQIACTATGTIYTTGSEL